MPKTVTQRRISSPSPDMQAFIDAANLGIELSPDLGELLVELGSDGVFKVANNFTPRMLEYLNEGGAHEIAGRYDALRLAQEQLPSLANQRSDYQSMEFVCSRISAWNVLYVHNGIIGASGHFYNVVAGVDARRLGRCAVCEKVLWATRVNSECCSLKCRKTFNKRNSRTAPKEHGGSTKELRNNK